MLLYFFGCLESCVLWVGVVDFALYGETSEFKTQTELLSSLPPHLIRVQDFTSKYRTIFFNWQRNVFTPFISFFSLMN